MAKAFNDAYKAAFKTDSSTYSPEAYDATNLLLTAIKAALDSNSGVADAKLSRDRATALVDTLTSRQRQVLLGILRGLQNKIIAFDLGLSIRTIETYRAQLMEKLNVRGTAEAVRLALAAGLAETPVRAGRGE